MIVTQKANVEAGYDVKICIKCLPPDGQVFSEPFKTQVI